jgi:hypothetical protein
MIYHFYLSFFGAHFLGLLLTGRDCAKETKQLDAHFKFLYNKLRKLKLYWVTLA